jgi:hypothetical protein
VSGIVSFLGSGIVGHLCAHLETLRVEIRGVVFCVAFCSSLARISVEAGHDKAPHFAVLRLNSYSNRFFFDIYLS